MSRLIEEPIPKFTDEDKAFVHQLMIELRCCQGADPRCVYGDCRAIHPPVTENALRRRHASEGEPTNG